MPNRGNAEKGAYVFTANQQEEEIVDLYEEMRELTQQLASIPLPDSSAKALKSLWARAQVIREEVTRMRETLNELVDEERRAIRITTQQCVAQVTTSTGRTLRVVDGGGR